MTTEKEKSTDDTEKQVQNNSIINKEGEGRSDTNDTHHKMHASQSGETRHQKVRVRPADVDEVTGILDVKSEGYGFLRCNNFSSSNNDVYVSQTQIKRFNLKRRLIP